MSFKSFYLSLFILSKFLLFMIIQFNIIPTYAEIWSSQIWRQCATSR